MHKCQWLRIHLGGKVEIVLVSHVKDGNDCGYFVREQNPDDIVEAIKWCQTNKELADSRCSKAYEKVKASYDTHIVMDIYKSLFIKLYSKI